MDDDLRYWLGFNLVRGIGPVRLRALIAAFGTIKAAWSASESDLLNLHINQRAIANLVRVRRDEDLGKLLERLDRVGAQAFTWDSPDYPALLDQIPDAPPLIFVRGTLAPSDAWAVAMVGTRKVTPYGREVAQQLAARLSRSGVTLVSGLARGIDGIVHRTALEEGGRTIAVLGSGVDIIYPPEHQKLADAIVENGAIISDYPLGAQPEAANFPPRNRLISGLSLGTVVVEAGLRSGALITADFALDQGREVFAVPGSILTSGSAGCNRLLRDGAHVVTEASDILEVLHLEQVPEKQSARLTLPETPAEAALFQHLSAEPQHLDALARASSMAVEVVSSTLVMMELKGMVRQVGGLQYVRVYEPRELYTTD